MMARLAAVLVLCSTGAAFAQQTPFTPMPSQQRAAEQPAPPAPLGTPSGQTVLAPAPVTAPVDQRAVSQSETVMQYVPPDLDSSLAGGEQPQGAAGGGIDPFIGVEFETLRRRVVTLEERIETLERLVAQQAEILRSAPQR